MSENRVKPHALQIPRGKFKALLSRHAKKRDRAIGRGTFQPHRRYGVLNIAPKGPQREVLLEVRIPKNIQEPSMIR